MSRALPGGGSRPYDERLLRLAIALGRRHNGLTSPNPAVGALVVQEGEGVPCILGQGVTAPGGRPHAEPLALVMAGEAARGATLYVSLEPCSHQGRTPPCVDAVLAAGVARVVTALEDPDPRVSGQGHARLRAAGVAVEVATGALAREARRAHPGHILRVTQGRPAVTVKIARTADGYAGRRTGPRLMITGEGANARVHLMRAHADVILAGVNTILADDPLLTVRLPGLEARSPVRVILDSRLRTPPTARVVASAAAYPTWIVTTAEAPAEPEAELSARGVVVLRVASQGPRVDLPAALRGLAERGVTRIFCEGGPTLADALAAAGLIDELVLATGAATLAEPGLPALGPRLAAALPGFRPLGSDVAGPDRIDSFERIA